MTSSRCVRMAPVIEYIQYSYSKDGKFGRNLNRFGKWFCVVKSLIHYSSYESIEQTLFIYINSFCFIGGFVDQKNAPSLSYYYSKTHPNCQYQSFHLPSGRYIALFL